jgi:hypothetical protein
VSPPSVVDFVERAVPAVRKKSIAARRGINLSKIVVKHFGLDGKFVPAGVSNSFIMTPFEHDAEGRKKGRKKLFSYFERMNAGLASLRRKIERGEDGNKVCQLWNALNAYYSKNVKNGADDRGRQFNPVYAQDLRNVPVWVKNMIALKTQILALPRKPSGAGLVVEKKPVERKKAAV